MKITLEWLNNNGACSEGFEWFKNQDKSELKDVINSLNESNHWNWANWVIVRFMTHKQKVQYAVFAAEQVIDIYEKKYPEDDRPRKAIEAAKKWIKNPSATATAAYAVDAAYAVYGDDAAAYASYAAAYAVRSAAYASYAAAYAVRSACAAARSACAADAADDAARAVALKKMRTEIIKYGLSILKTDHVEA